MSSHTKIKTAAEKDISRRRRILDHKESLDKPNGAAIDVSDISLRTFGKAGRKLSPFEAAQRERAYRERMGLRGGDRQTASLDKTVK